MNLKPNYLVVLLFFYTLSGFCLEELSDLSGGPKDVYIFVSGKDPELQAGGLEIKLNLLWQQEFEKVIKKVNPRAKIEIINTDQLNDAFYNKIIDTIGENERLSGLAFFGHGNPKRYSLNNTDGKFTAHEMTSIIIDIFERVKTSPTFNLYLGACSTGCPSEGDQSFLELLAAKLEKGRKDIYPKILHIIGHPFYSDRDNIGDIKKVPLYWYIYKYGGANFVENQLIKVDILGKKWGSIGNYLARTLPASFAAANIVFQLLPESISYIVNMFGYAMTGYLYMTSAAIRYHAKKITINGKVIVREEDLLRHFIENDYRNTSSCFKKSRAFPKL